MHPAAASEASMPRSKLDRKHMIAVITQLQNGEFESDEQLSSVLDSLIYSTGNPHVPDLIFHPRGPELTPEQIVDEALRYPPLIGRVDEPPNR
jgi:hypothetical protein